MSKTKKCTNSKKSCEKRCTAPKLVSDNLEKIILNDDELVGLKTKQQELVALKVELANFVLHTSRSQKSFENVISTKENEYLEEARALAKSHGVDPDSPDAGKWNLNLDEKTLIKV